MEAFTLLFLLIALIFINKIYQWLYVFIHIKFFNGYGLLTSKAIESFLYCECGKCSNNIPAISLGNSVMINQDGPLPDRGFTFKCADCRNLSLPAPEKNVGRDVSPSLKSANVNGVSVIYKLIRALRRYKKINHDWEKWLIALYFFRDGVYGYLQYGNFSQKWHEAERDFFGHPYDDIPHNCPECGLCIGTGAYEDDHYDEVKKQGYCSTCKIPVKEMWTFRENGGDDRENIKSLIT